jgi:rhodanese-related sulfurtransferase
MHLKLIFATDGRVLGAQATGGDGVDKRIDVIATTIQHDGTVFDLAEAELCYAPQFGSAKDPVNMAGMMATNVLAGDMRLADWSRVADDDHVVLDVREPAEVARGTLSGALTIPLHQLRERLPELPRDKPLWLLCAAGQRAYVAQRILSQRGFDARVLSGGITTWKAMSST